MMLQKEEKLKFHIQINKFSKLRRKMREIKFFFCHPFIPIQPPTRTLAPSHPLNPFPLQFAC